MDEEIYVLGGKVLKSLTALDGFTIQEAKKWIKALRSGEYKQTKYTLERKTGDIDYPRAYCCLGVSIGGWVVGW